MKVELELQENIYEALVKESDRLGITVVELIRHEIGKYANPPVFSSPLTSLPISYPHSDDAHTSMKDLLIGAKKMYKEIMADAGMLTCRNCTQHLNAEDIQKGICSRCEATV